MFNFKISNKEKTRPSTSEFIQKFDAIKKSKKIKSLNKNKTIFTKILAPFLDPDTKSKKFKIKWI